MDTAFRRQFDKVDQQLELLLDSLNGYSEEDLNRRPAPNKWSAMMVLHHLKLGEELTLKYLQKKLSFNPKLKQANFITTMRGLVLRYYFKLPLKIKAPEVVSEVHFPEGVPLAQLRKEWLQYRKELRNFLEPLDQDLYDRELYKHPIGGKMRLIDMLRFFEVHMRHHEKQIRKALQVPATAFV